MKIKKIIYVFLVIALLSACSSTQITPNNSDIVITDSTGHSVTLSASPQRIVIAGRATVLVQDAVYLFGEAEERVVSLENRRQSVFTFLPFIDSLLENKELLEKNAGPEQIAALQPDLVILKNSMAEQLGSPLELIGIPVIYLDLENPDAFYQDIATLGQVFDNGDRAEEVIEYFQSRVENIKSTVKELNIEEKPSVLILQHSDSGDEVAFEVPPAAWLQTAMVEMAGGNPVWLSDNVNQGWTIVTIEDIAVWNPDQIYIINYDGGAGDAVDAVLNDSIWQELQAAQNDSIFAFPFDFYSWDQPDPRWIMGFQWLAAKIHPQLFEDFILVDEVEEFYSQLYLMDSESINTNVIPLLIGDID